MGDKLRRERDEAITKLATAIRDSDDVKRQREKVEKELRDMRFAGFLFFYHSVIIRND